MSKRKLSPLVQAIAAYNALDDRARLELADYIRSQTKRTPKSTAASPAGRQSSRRRSVDESKASTETVTETASAAGGSGD